MGRWFRRFEGAPTFLRIGVAVTLSIVIAVIDLMTGYELSVGVFYLFPVFLISWSVSRKAGILLAVWNALLWHLADIGAGHTYSSNMVGYWNSAVRLGYFLSVAHLSGRLREEQTRQRVEARIDPLTRLFNRRAFLEIAEREERNSRRVQSPTTLAYIDLDNFKAINDRLGHGVGDELLKVVALTLQAGIRESDTAARLGGDEFAVLLPRTNIEGAERFLEGLRSKLLKAMRAYNWPVTFSIGSISFSRPFTAKEMVERADALMYAVKNNNKNDVNCAMTSGEFFTQATQSF